MDKMKDVLSHVGAWAPKAEQVASAKYLVQTEPVNKFLGSFKKNIQDRLEAFYTGFSTLKKEGFKVQAIAPQAAIYLTVQLDLRGLKTSEGKILATAKDVTSYILEDAKLAIVPFYAFGSAEDSSWYRLSVGTCTLEEIGEVINKLRVALKKLS
jgi:aspartate aminotransferase